MKVSKSIRISAQDSAGSWKTEETSVELDNKDISVEEVKDHRKVLAVLEYECDLFLCKTTKDPCFAEHINGRLLALKNKKGEIDEFRKEIGII